MPRSEADVYLLVLGDKSTMDWTNEKVLELIELIRKEPAIWNRKENSNQNRQGRIEAWERIQSKFSTQCPIEELKRKRNCLMTAYRDYMRKIKKSSTSSLSPEDVYRPTWFAFNALNSFMHHKYGLDINIKSEGTTSNRDIRDRWPSRDSDINSQSLQTESETSQHSVYLQEYSRKRRISQELQTLPKKPMNENLILYKESSSNEKKSKVNEYDLYGQLLAEKLKKMDEGGRLMVMNEIDNLVFKYAVNARSRSKQSVDSSAYIVSSHQNHLKASGSGTNKKKTMLTQQITSQHDDTDSSSNDN